MPDSGLVEIMGDGSDIVRSAIDDYFYVTIRQETGSATERRWRGRCVMRTKDLGDSHSSRAWGGSGFTVALADAYRNAISNPILHLCAPLFRWPIEGFGESVS